MLLYYLFAFNPFYFIHYSDPQIGRNVYAIPNCSIAVHQIAALTPSPSFIIICGDMANDPSNQSLLYSQWLKCDSLFDVLPMPKYYIPGNRDLGYASDNFWTPQRLTLYRGFWGMDYYSFDYDSCKFIGLNSTLLDTYSGHQCYQYALEQDSFLRTTLNSIGPASYRHIFMFHHFPLYVSSPTEANNNNNVDRPRRDTLLKYLINHKMTGVFTGHLHYNLINFYGTALLPSGLSTSETNINQCGYRVVKVFAHGIETYTIWLTAPPNSVPMNPIIQAQLPSETLLVNHPFTFSCIADTINFPDWQGLTYRWVFKPTDTVYAASGSYAYLDTGHYDILLTAYKLPHLGAIYRFPVVVRQPICIKETTITPTPNLFLTQCSITEHLILYSNLDQHGHIIGYAVDGRRFEIYRGQIKAGKNKIPFPENLGAGVYFVKISVSGISTMQKFIYIK